MYTLSIDNNVMRINIVGPSHNPDQLKVHIVVSPEKEAASMWGQITFDIHRSRIFRTHEAAQRAAFKSKLSGEYRA